MRRLDRTDAELNRAALEWLNADRGGYRGDSGAKAAAQFLAALGVVLLVVGFWIMGGR